MSNAQQKTATDNVTQLPKKDEGNQNPTAAKQASEKAASLYTGKLYTSAAAILAAAKKQSTIDAKSVKEWQKILLSTLAHVEKNRDISVVRNIMQIIEQMHTAYRKDSAVAWFVMFGPVYVDEKGVLHFSKSKKTDLEGAKKKGWWLAKKPEIFRPFVLREALQNIVDKAEDLVEAGEDLDKHDIDQNLLAGIEKILNGRKAGKKKAA